MKLPDDQRKAMHAKGRKATAPKSKRVPLPKRQGAMIPVEILAPLLTFHLYDWLGKKRDELIPFITKEVATFSRNEIRGDPFPVMGRIENFLREQQLPVDPAQVAKRTLSALRKADLLSCLHAARGKRAPSSQWTPFAKGFQAAIDHMVGQAKLGEDLDACIEDLRRIRQEVPPGEAGPAIVAYNLGISNAAASLRQAYEEAA